MVAEVHTHLLDLRYLLLYSNIDGNAWPTVLGSKPTIRGPVSLVGSFIAWSIYDGQITIEFLIFPNLQEQPR